MLVSFSYTCLTVDMMCMYVLRGAEARRVMFHQPINRQAARLEAATGLVTCRVSHDEEGKDLRVMRCLRTWRQREEGKKEAWHMHALCVSCAACV